MSAWRKLLTEPLLQFLVIGLVLFVADRMTREEQADPRLIRVDDEAYARLAYIYKEANDRVPTIEEMPPLVERFIINETLYREARSLRLDEGDEMMRSRLVQRMRLMLYSGIAVDAPSDEVLQEWLAERPDRYDVQPAISFQVIGLDATEEEARAEAEAANTRAAAGESAQTEGKRMFTFSGRPRAQMVAAFEESFIAAIEAAPQDIWTAVPSSRGWQVVQLLGTEPGRRPEFAEIRAEAIGDWQEERLQFEARASLDALLDGYPVEHELYDPERIKTILDARAEAAQ